MEMRGWPYRLITLGCLGIALLLAWSNHAWPSSVYASSKSSEHEITEVVVKLNPAAGATIVEINYTYGTTTLKTLIQTTGIYLLQVPDRIPAHALAKQMRRDARLLYAEPNYGTHAPEGSPSSIKAWGGATEDTFNNQYAMEVLNLPSAHAINRGAGTVVAVLDTGVQLDHLALASHLTAARYDFVADDAVPEDEFTGAVAGHGTHVAGIIHLVAPESQIMPLRVLDTDGSGNIFTIAEAIIYAAHNGADVINLSLGTPDPSALLADTIHQVTKQGVVVVAAAGNLNSEVQEYPATHRCAISVTSVGQTGTKSAFANFNRLVDFAAPGEAIASTFPPNGYTHWSGTSMATPFVAGQVTLLRSTTPSLSIRGLVAVIEATAHSLDSVNPAYKGKLGWGQPDIGASLQLLTTTGAPPSGGTTINSSCFR